MAWGGNAAPHRPKQCGKTVAAARACRWTPPTRQLGSYPSRPSRFAPRDTCTARPGRGSQPASTVCSSIGANIARPAAIPCAGLSAGGIAMCWRPAFIFCLVVPMFLGPASRVPAQAGTRCGFYAGIGYHCFGTEGGTGGTASDLMRQDTRRCGYFDPGCKMRTNGDHLVPQYGPTYHAPRSGPTYRTPKSDFTYRPPEAGPGFVDPTTGPVFIAPRATPGYIAPHHPNWPND